MEVRNEEFVPANYANGRLITVGTEFDNEFESVGQENLAKIQRDAIEAAILAYREGRTEEARTRVSLAFRLGGHLPRVSLIDMDRSAMAIRRLDGVISRYLGIVEEATQELARREAIATIAKTVIRLLAVVICIVAVYYFLTLILLEFPETRGFAQLLISYVAKPMMTIGRGILSHIPDLVALVLIAAITRYLLRLIKLYFVNLEAGGLRIKGFEKHWIWPTTTSSRACSSSSQLYWPSPIYQDLIRQRFEAFPFFWV